VLVRKVQWDPLESVALSTRRYLEAAAAAMACRLRRDEVRGQEMVGLVEDHDEAQDPSPRISGIDEVTRQQRPSDRGSRSRVTPSLVELCVGPVSEPPGMAGVDRSKAPPLVTIQSTAPRIVIPTTPAAMRWFRRLRSRRRSVHSTVFSVFTFTCPVSARILAASRPAPLGASGPPRSRSASEARQ